MFHAVLLVPFWNIRTRITCESVHRDPANCSTPIRRPTERSTRVDESGLDWPNRRRSTCFVFVPESEDECQSRGLTMAIDARSADVEGTNFHHDRGSKSRATFESFVNAAALPSRSDEPDHATSTPSPKVSKQRCNESSFTATVSPREVTLLGPSLAGLIVTTLFDNIHQLTA